MTEFIKKHLQVGDRVAFKIKRNNRLVTLIGIIKEIIPAGEARRRGVRIKRAGRVFAIRAKGKIYYKHQTTVIDPRTVKEKSSERDNRSSKAATRSSGRKPQ